MPLKQIGLRLDLRLLQRLDKHIRRRRQAGRYRTRAAVIRAAIVEYLERRE